MRDLSARRTFQVPSNSLVVSHAVVFFVVTAT